MEKKAIFAMYLLCVNIEEKGIQTKLIGECIKFAQEQNLEILKLSSDNPEAISIYKKYGFEKKINYGYYVK